MERSASAPGRGAGIVALFAILVTWPDAPRVSGSVPLSVSLAVSMPVPLAPPSERAALLESQGEFVLAEAALEADSLSSLDPENVRARLRIACRRGDTARARALLAAHDSLFASDVAHLLGAALAAKAGDPAACLATLEGGPVPAGLEAYAAWLEAEAAAATARWEQAAAAASRVRDAHLPLEMQQRLQVVRGFVAQQQGDWSTLRRLAPDLGEAARRDDRTGLLLLAVARAAADSGAVAQAREWRLDLLEARPTPAESAYVALTQGGVDDTTTAVVLRLARFEMRSGRSAAARTRLESALGARRTAASRRPFWLPLAESSLRGGDPAGALPVLERAATDLAHSEQEPERLRLRARALRRLGRTTEARGVYQELARRFPAHRLADDALYEIGWLQENDRALAAAERAYVRCAHAFPRGSLADDARLRAGLCALRDARPAEATAHFAALVAQHSTSSLADNALYWQLLAAERRRDAAGAVALGARLESAFPRSYFTVLARERVAGETPPAAAATRPESATGASAAPGDFGLERAQRARAAFAQACAALQAVPGLQVPAGLEAESRLWRFLLDHGLVVEASWEARRLEKRYQDDPGALLGLLAVAAARGAHERSVRWAYKLGQRLPDGASRDAAEVLLFPAPYGVSVAGAAARHGLSHAVVLGLMRQESAFDPRIDSGAGARGLMQIMPEVGRRLAAAAGVTAWHADALYDPERNLELGCTLLAEELTRAGGNVAQALAAYNAGGDLARAWAARLGPQDPPEMYLDVAEYAETRNYLKTVLGNVETYRRLYALP